MAELDLAAVAAAYKAPVAARPSRFPAMRHDVTLLLPLDVPAGQVIEVLRSTAGESGVFVTREGVPPGRLERRAHSQRSSAVLHLP
ncbi:hypothetical protein [Sorangium sp. So ce887]|uniref:hypothetical protein n=1 Tax=Sorangium sp. So ce887 TaxID=3133324 RepID=UPI003F5F47F2